MKCFWLVDTYARKFIAKQQLRHQYGTFWVESQKFYERARVKNWLVSLHLSLPLKVAKSPNLKRLSRDLLLEILDAMADHLKDSNIAVNSWQSDILRFRKHQNQGSIVVFKLELSTHASTRGIWILPCLSLLRKGVMEKRGLTGPDSSVDFAGRSWNDISLRRELRNPEVDAIPLFRSFRQAYLLWKHLPFVLPR